jgi:hypothetical protein
MWPPHKVNIDGLCGARQGSQKTQYVFFRHARRQSLLRAYRMSHLMGSLKIAEALYVR